MAKLHFELVSPEALLLSEEVDLVTVPGLEGDFGVLANHAPLIAVLRPGIVVIQGASEGPPKIFVRGGFAEVTPDGLTILAEEAIPLSELNGQRLAEQIQNAVEDVADAKTEETRRRAQEQLDRLRELEASLGQAA